MIELIVILILCSKNNKNATMRGKSGGVAIGYTIGLWVGGEILGAVIGVVASGGVLTPPVYIAALLFAVGGGIASYFIAKSGPVVTQNMPLASPQPSQQPPYAGASQPVQQAMPAQQPQYAAAPHFASQPVQQPVPVQPAQQPAPQPAQQSAPVQQPQYAAAPHFAPQPVQQPMPVQPAQQPVPQPAQQSAPVQQVIPVQSETLPVSDPTQTGTATIIFIAKKVPGQFLVSRATIEVNGVPYQAGFKKPITILAPAGNVRLVCYLNYLGMSGIADAMVTLEPGQSYNVEYNSPLIVSDKGVLIITSAS